MKSVYLISSEDIEGNVVYKIGISSNPEKRLKQLQTGNSNILKIIKIFKTNYASKVEAYIHKLYCENNVLNEWFVLGNDDIDGFLGLCEKINKIYVILHNQNSYYQEKML